MDEKTRILKMVAEGTITPEQAAGLLEALEADKAVENAPVLPVADYDRKLLKIVVDSSDGDKVNVQLPIKGVKKIIQATGKLPVSMGGMEGVDMDQMMEAVSECLDSQVVGDFVSVESTDGDKVRIFVE